MRQCVCLVALAALATVVAAPSEAAATGLLRYPDVHSDRVVFTHAGDLWIASTKGGAARRLTAHPGLELFAKFSPDGRTIAFTAQYDGDEQVYVMPADGGEPRQLTFYPARGPLPARWGFDHQVYGFTPDGKGVLFRSLREYWSSSQGRLYTVPVAGGAPTALAPPVAGAGALSPDGRRLLYSPLFRDFRTWKRYQGGWAQDLYIYDLERAAIERVTEHPRVDRDPMWIGDAIYFASDRDGHLNLYRYDPASKKTTQRTKHTDGDVRWPSADAGGGIVYELAGRLRLYDTKTGRDRALDIQVHDDGVASRPREVSVDGHIESFALSPSGKRALLVARGDIFDVPTEHGLTRNITHSSNAHERDAVWSADGAHIAFISDVTGEEELWVFERATGKHRQLSFRSAARLSKPRWSPDARRIAYSDKSGALFVVDVATRAKVLAGKDPTGRMSSYEWSPRGGHLAFTAEDATDTITVYVYSVEDGKIRRATDPTFDAWAPNWGPKGDHLYYLSNRDFGAQFGVFDFTYVGNKATGIYGITLRKDVANPFGPKDDEVMPKDKDKDKKEKKKKKKKKAGKKASGVSAAMQAVRDKGFIKIDFEGMERRVFQVPMPTSNYDAVTVTPTHVLALDSGEPFLGRDDVVPTLHAYDIEKEKSEVLARGVQGYAVSGSRKHVLIRTKEGLAVIQVGKSGPDGQPKPLPTGGLRATVDPKQEWAAMFDEVWRRFRDYFYVSNMNGFDWAAIRYRYRPLLGQVTHREELNDLLGQMVAELEVSHAYISGGDMGLPPRPQIALLGARLDLDPKAARYRIGEIFAGHNEESRYRSPLTEVGVDARVGDYVLEINGRELLARDNPFRILRGALGQPVELLLNDKPTPKGARRVLVRPIGSEAPLRYLAWVADRRARVDKATDGKIGYLHLPDMGANGIREFTKWYRPQIHKEGLIVDVRDNGGGFVSQLIIERLRRKLLGTGFARNSAFVETYPYAVMHGPMVCLIDETSGSDGDIFPWAFRSAGLGPLIGKRTWGGVVGITNHGPLLDGGSVYVPEFSTNGPDGGYIIEGEGVAPDIEVDNNPVAVARGEDPQLERAIREVLARHAKGPRLPVRPAPPDKRPRR